MKKSGYIVLFMVSVVILLSVVQAILSNVLSTSGVMLSKINSEIQVYKTENAVFKEKLYIAQSLTDIADRASKLGFKEQKSQLVLTTSTSVLTRSFSQSER